MLYSKFILVVSYNERKERKKERKKERERERERDRENSRGSRCHHFQDLSN